MDAEIYGGYPVIVPRISVCRWSEGTLEYYLHEFLPCILPYHLLRRASNNVPSPGEVFLGLKSSTGSGHVILE